MLVSTLENVLKKRVLYASVTRVFPVESVYLVRVCTFPYYILYFNIVVVAVLMLILMQ